MHELDADGAAVSVTQALQDFANGQGLIVRQRGAIGEQVELAVAEAIVTRLQLGRLGARSAQGIQLSQHVAAYTVIADQLI